MREIIANIFKTLYVETLEKKLRRICPEKLGKPKSVSNDKDFEVKDTLEGCKLSCYINCQ